MFYEIDGGKLFAFAGIWESWWGQGEDKPPLETCTNLTTAPNALASRFHDRMPVILHPDDYDPWMQGEEIPLVSFEAERMTAKPVSTFVNSVKNQGPEGLEPRTDSIAEVQAATAKPKRKAK